MPNKDIISPLWNVYVDGSILDSQKKYIKSVDIRESVNGSDTCTIFIMDEDNTFVSDALFVDDAKIYAEIFWMPGHLDKFEGYISAFDIDFPQEGVTTLSLFCLDKTHRMNKKRRSRTFEGMDKGSVLRSIAQEYGFGCNITPGYNTENTSFTQSSQTDIEFCEGLVEDEAFGTFWRAKLIGNILNYTTYGDLTTPKVTLEYRRGKNTVLSFKPNLTSETDSETIPATGGDGGGGGGGGVTFTTANGFAEAKMKPFKVTLPNGTVVYTKTLQEGNTLLQKAREEAGLYPPKLPIDFTKPVDERFPKNAGSIGLRGKADNNFANLLAGVKPTSLPPPASTLLPAGPTVKLYNPVTQTWKPASEKSTPIKAASPVKKKGNVSIN